jgi:hypothetical protein
MDLKKCLLSTYVVSQSVNSLLCLMQYNLIKLMPLAVFHILNHSVQRVIKLIDLIVLGYSEFKWCS